MKKSMLTLAVLGSFAGAAVAQSNVQIFGIIDVAVSRIDNGQSNISYLSDWQLGRPNVWTVHSSSSSRIGFRGTEDLGNGLKASFLLDHRFQPDTGTVEPRDGASFSGGTRVYGSGFWNAQSYVALASTDFGEIRAGRQATPTFVLGLATDPWGMEYNVAGLAGFVRGGNFIGASNNAVQYLSPSVGGFSVNVLVGAGEGGAAATATSLPNGRDVGVAVKYNAGPLMATLAYNDSRRSDAILNRTYALGATYDFGTFKGFANYSVGQNAIAGNARMTTWLLGAHIPMGPGYWRVGFGHHAPPVGFNPNSITPGATAATTPNPYAAYPVLLGQTSNKIGIGYVYVLSKRTQLQFDYGTNKTETYSRSNGVQSAIRHAF